jgi:bifunctional DNase/RNase
MERFECSSPGCRNEAKLFTVLVSADGTPSEPAFCPEHYHELGISWALPDLRKYAPRMTGEVYEECAVHAVLIDHQRNESTVILKTRQKPRVFVLPTGYVEAGWISNVARKTEYRNTPTHQLIVDIISALGGSASRAVVHGYEKDSGIYLCYLSIERAEGAIKLNCRVSDAIAIAHFAKIPIVVNTALLGELLPGSPERGVQDAHTRYVVVVKEDENGLFVASCPSRPGLEGRGTTPPDAVASLKAAYFSGPGSA